MNAHQSPDRPAAQRILAAHADWSLDERKRWISIAMRRPPGWHILSPQPVGDPAGLLVRLRALGDGAPVVLGVDLPLGLPRAYAANRSERDFPHFLRCTRAWPAFYRVCPTLAEVQAERPFYPARGQRGMTRAAHAAALGLPDAAALCRACDCATTERPAGAPLFWTLGANQAGKAAIHAWQTLLLPALEAGDDVRLWPFAGPLRSLLAPGAVALAETYPAEALRHLGIRLAGSKRRQADRAAVAAGLREAMRYLHAEPEPELQAGIAGGFGADAAGEDRFDSLLGLLCVLNVLAGNRPDTAPDDPWIQRWEGWVLGQTAMPREAKPPPLARMGGAAG